MDTIQLHDKSFESYISETILQNAIASIAKKITIDFTDKEVLFLSVLNGSFIFSADLIRQCSFKSQISFVKLSSYQNTQSTGKVTEIIGLDVDLTDKNIVILEDIVDTGTTLEKLMELLKNKPYKQLKVASLFLKPSVYKKPYSIDYVGIEIPNDFIVGYGLDYNGLGRNLTSVYKLTS